MRRPHLNREVPIMISAIGCQKAHREWRAHSRRAAQGQHRRDGRPIKPAPRATPAILRV